MNNVDSLNIQQIKGGPLPSIKYHNLDEKELPFYKKAFNGQYFDWIQIAIPFSELYQIRFEVARS